MTFHVEHHSVAGLLKSASRPWLVIERYHSGYKHEMQSRIVDRYETKQQAQRRARDLNKR